MNEKIKIDSFRAKDSTLSVEGDIIRYQGQQIEIRRVTGVKFWVEAVILYRFLLGRQYRIGFRTDSEELHIQLNSYLGIGDDYFADLCDRIMDEVWEPIVTRLLQTDTALLLEGKEVVYDCCTVNQEGLLLPRLKAANDPAPLIRWDDLNYQKNFDRLVLNSKSDHSLWTNVYYKDSWNVEALASLLDWATQEGGLQEIRNAAQRS